MKEVRQPDVAAPESTGADSQLLGWSGTGRILIVDDSEPVRIVIARAVAKLGFAADLARDGGQALSIFAENPGLYAVALVDVKLPGNMSGVDVVRELRLLRPDIPAVLSSGYSVGEAMIESFARVDSVGFLHKPFKLDALAAALRTALGGQFRRDSM
jgi:two-component system cell cycle sensor histidine kinase/response regulator CckA